MKSHMKQPKKALYILIAVCIWLFIWQYAAHRINKVFFLPSVTDTVKAFNRLKDSADFYSIIFQTLSKISQGFIFAFLTGIILAVVSSLSDFVKILLLPVLKLIKAIPVASFIILALLWIRSDNLSVLISFLMVLPIIYVNVLQGIESVDVQLMEMSKVFKMGYIRKICYIYIPHVLPFLISGCKIGLGFCFKSGIAAEIIGLPPGSIGEQLYKAKLYLSIDELFAWTIVIVVISVIYEFVCMLIIQCFSKFFLKLTSYYSGYGQQKLKSEEVEQIICKNIGKSFDSITVISDFNYTFIKDRTTCILGSSGIGKTTLLNIIAGLYTPDYGSIQYLYKNDLIDRVHVSMVFQEDRLLEEFDAYSNIQAIYGNTYSIDFIRTQFDFIELKNYEQKPVKLLSGGMKRRIAIVRAALSEAPILLLDEPFKGLDEELKRNVIHYIKKHCKHKLIILVTHNANDIELMDGIQILMQ